MIQNRRKKQPNKSRVAWVICRDQGQLWCKRPISLLIWQRRWTRSTTFLLIASRDWNTRINVIRSNLLVTKRLQRHKLSTPTFSGSFALNRAWKIFSCIWSILYKIRTCSSSRAKPIRMVSLMACSWTSSKQSLTINSTMLTYICPASQHLWCPLSCNKSMSKTLNCQPSSKLKLGA